MVKAILNQILEQLETLELEELQQLNQAIQRYLADNTVQLSPSRGKLMFVSSVKMVTDEPERLLACCPSHTSR